MGYKPAIVFANGQIADLDRLRTLSFDGHLLIAVDGGMRHMRELGLWPDFLIGDLDSVTPQDILAVKEHSGEIRQYPIDKDETDLQLAINIALEIGCDEIIIAAALGGRLDQTLGNLFLLSRPDLQNIAIRLDDGREEIFLIRSTAQIKGTAGDIVSLLPLDGAAFDVKTEALKYPLNYEKLNPYETRGISNVMLTHHARVSLSRGILICIHTRQ